MMHFLIPMIVMILMMATAVSAFTTLPLFAVGKVHSESRCCSSSSSALYMAGGAGGGGFGGGGAAADNKKKKGASTASAALKPKQQWDRYGELKREDKIRVAVRIVGGGEGGKEDGDWIDVGRIKSKDNLYTEIAVARQRALIAEHAKRLFPFKISNKISLEWGYCTTLEKEGEDSSALSWTVVDKSILETSSPLVEGLEKIIGFEGKPDPATGYYCVYDDGKVQKNGL